MTDEPCARHFVTAMLNTLGSILRMPVTSGIKPAAIAELVRARFDGALEAMFAVRPPWQLGVRIAGGDLTTWIIGPDGQVLGADKLEAAIATQSPTLPLIDAAQRVLVMEQAKTAQVEAWQQIAQRGRAVEAQTR
jgi:hypothetical protein